MEEELMADSDHKMQDIHEHIFYVAPIWNKCFQMQGFEPRIIPE
jgi:hypothetical protein